MNLEQTIKNYVVVFEQSGIKPVKHEHDVLATDYQMQLQHCHWMLIETLHSFKENSLIDDYENRLKKICYATGFVQGILWSQSIYSLSKLKEDRDGTA